MAVRLVSLALIVGFLIYGFMYLNPTGYGPRTTIKGCGKYDESDDSIFVI